MSKNYLDWQVYGGKVGMGVRDYCSSYDEALGFVARMLYGQSFLEPLNYPRSKRSGEMGQHPVRHPW